MPDTKHPSDPWKRPRSLLESVLADGLLDHRDAIHEALRRIPALEAERDHLRQSLITAREALRLSSDWQPKDAARIVREAVAALDAALRRD